MRSHWLFVPAALAAATSAHAATYLNEAQAQEAIWPGAKLVSARVILSAQQREQIEKASGVRVRNTEVKAWRVQGGGWFIVDEVLGKHEFITYALGIASAGAVHGLEIMDYRETYGGQVRNASWRDQFKGKTSSARLKLDEDIKNISGATLSSKHVTDGVKRLLATYEIALKAN